MSKRFPLPRDEECHSPGGGGGSEPPAGPEYATLDELDDKTYPPGPCWGCRHKFRKPQIPGQYPQLDDLWEVFENSDDLNIHDRAEAVARKHEELIFKPQLLGGSPQALAWPTEMVKKHLLVCRTDVETILAVRFRNCNKVVERLETILFFKDGQGVDHKNLDDYSKSIKLTIAIGEVLERMRQRT